MEIADNRYHKSVHTDEFADRVIFFLAILIATLVTGICAYRMQVTAETRTQEHLASEVLRFHILANSDSDADQNLKMQVKEQVLAYLKDKMPENLDADGTKAWMRSHTDELEEVSRTTVLDKGYDYPVSAAVTTAYFPDKTYGDVTFPAGNYEALRIEIGAAKGHNWWCVLYPNLCFTDAVNAVVPEDGKEELKNVLTEDEYSMVTDDSKFKVKSYFLDKILKN